MEPRPNPATAPPTWLINRLLVSLRPAGDRYEIFEEWTVLAVGTLAQLPLSTTGVKVLYGAEHGCGQAHLPRVLAPGDEHRLALVRHLPTLPTDLLYDPPVRVGLLTVHVRFAAADTPRRVWERTAGSTRRLVVSPTGEVTAPLHDAVPGQRYGVFWSAAKRPMSG